MALSSFFHQTPVVQEPPSNAAIPAGTSAARKAIDPLTGREIDASGFGVAGSEVGATVAHGFEMDVLSDKRRDDALAGLSGLLNDPALAALQNSVTQQLGGKSLDEDYIRRLVSLGVDKTGQTTLQQQTNLQSSLGVRGIGTNSPLAAALGAQLEQTNLSGIRTAQRDIGIEALRLMAQQRALGLQSAQNLLNYKAGLQGNIANVQMNVPTYGYDALQGLAELRMQKYEADKARKAGKKANALGTIGAALGAVGQIGAAIGGVI